MRTLLTQDLLPCVVVYGIVVWLLVRYRRAPVHRTGAVDAGAPLGTRLRPLATTIAGGYLVFVVLAGGISLLAGESASYVGGAILGGAILAFAVVAPLFGAALWVERRRRERIR